ncbi:MAG: M48 family metalloprotease [Candidatus Zipacnadales bacterium]
MARKGKPTKTKKVTLLVKDYQYPGERIAFLQAMWGIRLLFLILAAICAWQAFAPDTGQFLKNKHQVWIILLLYPELMIHGLNYLSARPRKMQLKKAGARAKVSPTNRPELHKLVRDASTLLCMKKPELYVLEDEVPYLYAVPGGAGSVLVSNQVLTVLQPEELAAAIAKQLGHLKSGHVAADLAITYIRNSNPLLKLVALPVTLMSFLMRGWQDMIDYTADRCSLLITRRLQSCTASMVKLAAAAVRVTQISERDKRKAEKRKQSRLDEAKTDRELAAEEAERTLAEISPEELDAYLAGRGELTDDAVQVERAFKISRFIEQQRNLKDRIRRLSEWAETEMCEEALAKVDAIRREMTSKS